MLISSCSAEFLGEEEADASVPLHAPEDVAEDDVSSR